MMAKTLYPSCMSGILFRIHSLCNEGNMQYYWAAYYRHRSCIYHGHMSFKHGFLSPSVNNGKHEPSQFNFANSEFLERRHWHIIAFTRVDASISFITLFVH